MRLTILQPTLVWENPVANRENFAQQLAPLRGQTDLVLLPEMFTTGFSMNAAALAEPMDGPTMQWLRQTADELGAAVAGSFICEDGGRFFNRLVFMRPGGALDFYDKKHLFSLAGEPNYFTGGKKRLTLEWRGWRICPLICYDLRFPVWSRNAPGSFAGRMEPLYDLLLYVANWPARRAHHWRSLLMARAIENQAYVAGANIVGTDGNGLDYAGDSALIDYSGAIIFEQNGQEALLTAELSLENLRQYRLQLPFLQDGDVFHFR